MQKHFGNSLISLASCYSDTATSFTDITLATVSLRLLFSVYLLFSLKHSGTLKQWSCRGMKVRMGMAALLSLLVLQQSSAIRHLVLIQSHVQRLWFLHWRTEQSLKRNQQFQCQDKSRLYKHISGANTKVKEWYFPVSIGVLYLLNCFALHRAMTIFDITVATTNFNYLKDFDLKK